MTWRKKGLKKVFFWHGGKVGVMIVFGHNKVTLPSWALDQNTSNKGHSTVKKRQKKL